MHMVSPTILCCQYARKGEQQSVHKLVVHDHEASIEKVNRNQDWPD